MLDPETIHYTDLEAARPGEVFHREWNAYLKELPRLLAEGLAGQFVLVLDDEIVDFYPTFGEAVTAGRQRFGLRRFLVQQVREREPILRLKWAG